jgi:hypothetical protein
VLFERCALFSNEDPSAIAAVLRCLETASVVVSDRDRVWWKRRLPPETSGGPSAPEAAKATKDRSQQALLNIEIVVLCSFEGVTIVALPRWRKEFLVKLKNKAVGFEKRADCICCLPGTIER